LRERPVLAGQIEFDGWFYFLVLNVLAQSCTPINREKSYSQRDKAREFAKPFNPQNQKTIANGF